MSRSGSRATARRRKALRRLYKAQRGRCYYCNLPMRDPTWRPARGETAPGDMATIEHKVPRAAGGTHHPDNLAAVCNSCNQAKSQRDARAASSVSGSRTTTATPTSGTCKRSRAWN